MQKQNICRKRSLREKRGITLIALIITIIVMLILVGVSIQIVINSNLFNTAKSAGEQTESKYEEDKTFGNKITINGKDYSNLNDYMGEIRLVGQSDGNGLKDYKIYGNSVQNGTPSPSTPVEIQSVGDKTKNLLNLTEFSDISNWDTTGTYAYYELDLEPGTYTYTFSTNLTEYEHILLLGRNAGSSTNLFGDMIGGTYVIQKNIYTFTIEEGESAYINWYVSNTLGGKTQSNLSSLINDVLGEFMIVEGNYTAETIPDYEPYGKYKIPVTATNETGENVTTNIYLDEPLRKIGEHADYIDFENQQVVRNIGFVLKDSTDFSIIASTSEYTQFVFPKGKYLPNIKAYGEILCSYVKQVATTYARLNNVYAGASNFNLCLDTSCTLQILQDLLDTTPMEICYQLTTPEITNVNLPTIRTLEGKNTITVQTQIQPSDMTAEF